MVVVTGGVADVVVVGIYVSIDVVVEYVTGDVGVADRAVVTAGDVVVVVVAGCGVMCCIVVGFGVGVVVGGVLWCIWYRCCWCWLLLL